MNFEQDAYFQEKVDHSPGEIANSSQMDFAPLSGKTLVRQLASRIGLLSLD